MPELMDALNGNNILMDGQTTTGIDDTLNLMGVENDLSRKWNPTLLLKKIYKVKFLND